MRAFVAFRSAIAVVLSAFCFAASASSAGTPGTALDVKAVAGPTYSHAGGEIRAAADVKAAAATPALDVSLYLSRNRKPDASDTRLDGTLAVPKLKPGQAVEVTGRSRLNSSVKPGRFFLLACPGEAKTPPGRGCAASSAPLRVTDVAVTTDELVLAAVDRKEITSEQGLIYRVLAAFGDPRVPAKYLGDDGFLADRGLMHEVVEAWPGLSAKTRAELTPFFSAPAAKGSWANGPAPGSARAGEVSGDPAPQCVKSPLADSDWDHLDTANGKVRIWWRKNADAARARNAAVAMRRDIDGVIWPKLSKLFARVPLSDAKVECFKGGDGRLDLYFNPLDRGRALTVAYPPRCSNVPAFILIPLDVDPWELTHELTHAFQFAHPYKAACDSYLWFDEGIANWAGGHVYPADDSEHSWPWFLEYPHSVLEEADYTSWVFGLYVEKVYGAATIARIYSAFAARDSLGAIDSVLRGGLKRIWPEFTRYAWNQDPLRRSFRQWDRVKEVPLAAPGRPLPRTELAIGGLDRRTLNVPVNMRYLSRFYRHLLVTDDNIRSLKFTNTLAGVPHAAVQAFVKLADGKWVTQDWTNRPSVEFCRDNDGEDVSELVILFSNGDFTAKKTIKPPKPPTLTLRNACDSLPFYYLVNGLTFEETAEGSGTDEYCGAVSGTESYSGELTTPTTGEPAGSLTRDGTTSQLYGAIDFKIPKMQVTYGNRSYTGCKHSDEGPVPCSVDFPDAHAPVDVPWGLRMYASSSEEAVRITWPVKVQSIGPLNTSDTFCNVHLQFRLPTEISFRYVPLATLAQTGPITLTNSGSAHVTEDLSGNPADADITWSYEITIQRVDENGDPLE